MVLSFDKSFPIQIRTRIFLRMFVCTLKMWMAACCASPETDQRSQVQWKGSGLPQLSLDCCADSFAILPFLGGGGHATCRILVSQPGIEPVPPAVEAWRFNHWTDRGVPFYYYSERKAHYGLFCWSPSGVIFINRIYKNFKLI